MANDEGLQLISFYYLLYPQAMLKKMLEVITIQCTLTIPIWKVSQFHLITVFQLKWFTHVHLSTN